MTARDTDRARMKAMITILKMSCRRVHKYADKFVYIETTLMIGAEKQKTQFHRGDIAYLTSNSSICVFVQDAKVQAMNSIGIVTSNLEIIESSLPGDVMIVKEASV